MHVPRQVDAVERAKIISSLLTAGGGSVSSFGDSDLRALLEHQMRSSVAVALCEDAIEPGNRRSEIDETLSRQGITTFADLFEHPAPSLLILRAVRRYAKDFMEKEPESFPPEVARVIYSLSELSIMKAGNGVVSAPISQTVISLGRWCLAQTWLDDRTGRLVRQGLDGKSAKL